MATTRRFTDISKWRNEWFRTLPQKAKLAWIYLCDECDFCGVWKADYGLASFQLDFTLTNQMIQDWFGNKVYNFDGDNVLLLQFFEFQYGSSKDTWTAKVKARERLEALGFKILKNKIVPPQSPTVDDGTPSVLIVGVGKGVVEDVLGESEGKFTSNDLESLYELYPNKVGKTEGMERLAAQSLTPKGLIDLSLAISNYTRYLSLEKNKTWLKAKQWDVFVGCKTKPHKPWHDWINPDPSIFIDTAPTGRATFDPMTAPLRGT